MAREAHWSGGGPEPGPDRPFLRYFSRCGGCAVQTLTRILCRWKRDLVAKALQRAGLTIAFRS